MTRIGRTRAQRIEYQSLPIGSYIFEVLAVDRDLTYSQEPASVRIDVIVFCSDGIIEAENGEGEIYGFERTAETVRQGCSEELSAEARAKKALRAASILLEDGLFEDAVSRSYYAVMHAAKSALLAQDTIAESDPVTRRW